MTRDDKHLIAFYITPIVILLALFLLVFLCQLNMQKQKLQFKQVQHQANKASWTQVENQVEYTVLEIKGHEYIATCRSIASGSTASLTHAAFCPCMKHTVE